MRCRFFLANDFSCTIDTLIIDFCNNDTLWFILKGKSIADCPQSHRSAAAKDNDITAFFCSHHMLIGAWYRMVIGMVATDYTADRLCHTACEIAVPFKCPKTSCFNDIIREDTVLRIATAPRIGISRTFHLSRNSRLLCKFLPGLKCILPFLSDLHDIPRKLMSDDDRMIGYIVGNTLMIGSLLYCFPCRHTDAVTDNLYQNLIILYFR